MNGMQWDAMTRVLQVHLQVVRSVRSTLGLLCLQLQLLTVCSIHIDSWVCLAATIAFWLGMCVQEGKQSGAIHALGTRVCGEGWARCIYSGPSC
jgi:hypothetical protein